MTLCSCVACTDRTQEPEKGQGGGNVQPAHFWDCECDIEQETYDLDNVALRFTFGYRSEHAKKRFYNDYYHDNYYDVDSHRTKPEYADFFDMNGHVKPEYESIMYPNVPIYLFFKSFGNLYLIKTVDDFFTDEYLGGNHTEEISIPSELFYNEYGMIQFSFTNDQDGGMGYFGGATIKSVCNIYYHKTGETVQLSKVDLAPPYEYHDYGNLEENKACKFSAYELTKQDYCAFITVSHRAISDTEALPVQLYFGRVYSAVEKNIPAVDIYIVTQNSSGEELKMLVKTIDDYMSDEYLCTRTYDYWGNIKEVIYNHYETINIPSEYYAGSYGSIEFRICEAGTQNKLSGIILDYELRLQHQLISFD